MSIPSQSTTSNESCDKLNSNQPSQFFSCEGFIYEFIVLLTNMAGIPSHPGLSLVKKWATRSVYYNILFQKNFLEKYYKIIKKTNGIIL